MNNEPTSSEKPAWSSFGVFALYLMLIFGIPTAFILIAAWVISWLF